MFHWSKTFKKNRTAAKNQEIRPKNRFTSLFVSLSFPFGFDAIAYLTCYGYGFYLNSCLFYSFYYYYCYAFYSWHFIIYGAEILDWCNLLLWYKLVVGLTNWRRGTTKGEREKKMDWLDKCNKISEVLCHWNECWDKDTTTPQLGRQPASQSTRSQTLAWEIFMYTPEITIKRIKCSIFTIFIRSVLRLHQPQWLCDTIFLVKFQCYSIIRIFQENALV